MGMKTKLLPSIFKNRELLQSSWQWLPSCTQPKKTLSFRRAKPESCFSNTTSDSTSFLAGHSEEEETIIREVMRSSDRLFFEPGEFTTSSILEPSPKEKRSDEEKEESPFKESVILAMETEDPYRDFKRSMQEMVDSYEGMKNWEWLQELLGWYLKMNGDGNHGVIVGAFVDLLLELSAPKTSSHSLSTSYSSAVSCFSSPLAYLGHNEIEEE